MKRLLMLIPAVLFFAAAPSAVAATKNVAIARSGFLPASVTIDVGDTITWTNNDTVNRSVVSDAGLFSSGILTPGQSYSNTFNQNGTFRYRDGTRNAVRARIIVRAPAAVSVTLSASKPSLIFGGEVVLSGAISTRLSGQPVTLVVRPFGGNLERVELTTGTDGAWRYEAQPRIQTVYSIEYRRATSPSATVNVRPRIGLRRVAANRFAVTVVAGKSFAGRVAYIARWASRTHRWVTVKRFVLVRSQSSSTVSVATVRARIARKTKVRVFLSQAQVQPGYVSGYSNFIRA
jgi:Cupredoxin-like domain